MIKDTAQLNNLAQDGSISDILETLERFADDPNLVLAGLAILQQLAYNPAYVEQMTGHNKLNQSMNVLSTNIHEELPRKGVLDLFCRILETRNECTNRMVDAWVIMEKELASKQILLTEDMVKFAALLKLEQYTLYGGGSVGIVVDLLQRHVEDEEVCKKACLCLQKKAWDPQKRLEFKEVPGFVDVIRKAIEQQKKSPPVLLAAVEMYKVWFERGLLRQDDERYDNLCNAATQTVGATLEFVQVYP